MSAAAVRGMETLSRYRKRAVDRGVTVDSCVDGSQIWQGRRWRPHHSDRATPTMCAARITFVYEDERGSFCHSCHISLEVDPRREGQPRKNSRLRSQHAGWRGPSAPPAWWDERY